MKGKFLSTVLAVFALIVSAQFLQAQNELKVGIVALPQSTWLLNADDMEAAQTEFDYVNTYGMAVGPSVGYNFTKVFGVRMNALYSAQGQKYTSVNGRGDLVTNTQRLNYLKLPLFLSINSNTEFRKLVFTFAAGYQANFLVGARYYNDDQSYTPDQALVDDITDYPTDYQRYSKLDHGAVVDFGLDIKLNYNLFANVHLRGDYSISDAENKDAGYKLFVNGVPQQETFYGSDRSITNNLTGGLAIGITYIFSNY